MKPNRSDEDLELLFLEQSLREDVKESPLRDLSAVVRERFESEERQVKGEEMSSMVIETTLNKPGEASRFDRKFWTLLANAACIGAIFFLIASFWNNGFFADKSDADRFATPVIQDEDDQEVEDHNEVLPVISVFTMADVKKLSPGATRILGASDQITDAVLLEIIRTQPNLVHLDIRQSWVTERSVRKLSELKHLTSLSLAWNEHISAAGWNSVTKLVDLSHLDLSGWVGQSASFNDFLPDPLPEPDPGVKPGAFMIHGLASLPKLRSLNISGLEITDEHLYRLGAKVGQRLTVLNISGTNISAEGIRSLSSWPRLMSLTATGSSNRSMSQLKAFANLVNLRTLELGASGMDSVTYRTEDLTALGLLPNLSSLEFRFVTFTEGQISMFTNPDRTGIQSSRALRELSFLYCQGVTDADCKTLANLSGLKKLRLVNMKKLSAKGFQNLVDGQTKVLDLRGTFTRFKTEKFKAALDKRPELSILFWRQDAKDLRLTEYFADSSNNLQVVLQGKLPKPRK
ncbi:MAG: hypothetical protein ACI97A_000066 [Planctomycetota bacterium]|jgi:hypothetical protein